jgi:hypothetical protein
MPTTVVADADNEHVSKLLEPYIQSGALNFLFGSGASFPAIATAGNIEGEIDAHLQAGEDEVAEKKSFAFLETINAVNRALLNGIPDANAVTVRERYQRFIQYLTACYSPGSRNCLRGRPWYSPPLRLVPRDRRCGRTGRRSKRWLRLFRAALGPAVRTGAIFLIVSTGPAARWAAAPRCPLSTW